MLGKIGIFLAGMLVAFLLDPRSGRQRRAQLNKRLAPVRQRVLARGQEALQDAGRAGPIPSAPDLLHSAETVARRVQDQIGDASETVGSMQAAAEQQARQAGAAHTPTPATPRTRRRPLPTQAPEATDVTPQMVAPTAQPDPIPEGDPDEKHPGETINDPTLVARIESEIYRDEALPKSKLNIDATHGVVTVRGTIEGEVADAVLDRIGAIEGVHEVVDKLHRGSTTAP